MCASARSLPGLRRLARRKSLSLREPLAPIIPAGEERARQQRPIVGAVGEPGSTEVAEGVVGQRLPLRPQLFGKPLAHALERIAPHVLQRGLELRALPAVHVAQPVIAAPEHPGQ